MPQTEKGGGGWERGRGGAKGGGGGKNRCRNPEKPTKSHNKNSSIIIMT